MQPCWRRSACSLNAADSCSLPLICCHLQVSKPMKERLAAVPSISALVALQADVGVLCSGLAGLLAPGAAPGGEGCLILSAGHVRLVQCPVLSAVFAASVICCLRLDLQHTALYAVKRLPIIGSMDNLPRRVSIVLSQ